MPLKNVLLVMVAICVALVILVALEVNDVLGARSFGIAVLVIMGIASVVGWLIARKIQTERPSVPIASPSISKSTAKYVSASVILIWLIISLWLTRDGPWIARLVGIAFLGVALIGIIKRKTG